MNIFALSRNPVEAAQQMIDKHIIKMPTETCQMLHTNILYMSKNTVKSPIERP